MILRLKWKFFISWNYDTKICVGFIFKFKRALELSVVAGGFNLKKLKIRRRIINFFELSHISCMLSMIYEFYEFNLTHFTKSSSNVINTRNNFPHNLIFYSLTKPLEISMNKFLNFKSFEIYWTTFKPKAYKFPTKTLS